MDIKIINKKQFYIATIIGGPLVAGLIVAHKYWILKSKRKACLSIFSGLILNFILEILIFLLFIGVVRPIGLQMNFIIAIVLLGFCQFIIAFLISKLLKIKNIESDIFPENNDYYNIFQIIPVLIICMVYLIVHTDIPILFAPFPNMIVLLYVLPHLYFYYKIKQVFKASELVKIFSVIIAVFACYMPLIFVLNDNLSFAIMNIPMYLAEYYLYTLLYLFILIFIVDIIGKLIVKFRLFPTFLLQKSLIKISVLIFIIITVVLILIYGNKRYNQIVVNSYNIQIQAKDANIKSLKICFVADMHLNNNTSQIFISNYIKQVIKINPDIMLFGGDIIESGRISKEKIEAFDKQQLLIKPKYGKYIVSGNHDRFKYSGYEKKIDINFLTDTIVEVANSFYLIGLSYRSFQQKPIFKLKELAKKNLPIFLLDHSPYQLDLAAKNGIDIQFSGHTHAGQVWPINYIIDLLYELPWGYRKINKTHFFVTSGIQGWGTPIRNVAQSEIMIINVEFVK